MSEANPQQEPSMEEILASIRRIISEDDKPDGTATESSEPDDVLELTEIAEDETPPEAQAPEEQPDAVGRPDDAEGAEEEDLSIDEVLDEVSTADELELRDQDAAAPPEPTPQPAGGGLLAAETEAAAGNSLSNLVAAVDRAHGGSTLGDGNRTIEDLVKEVMRPLVKEWLDENLPRLTERLVRREIERLARDAEGD